MSQILSKNHLLGGFLTGLNTKNAGFGQLVSIFIDPFQATSAINIKCTWLLNMNIYPKASFSSILASLPKCKNTKFTKLLSAPRAIPKYSGELKMAGSIQILGSNGAAASDWWRVWSAGHMTAVSVRHWLGAAQDRHCHLWVVHRTNIGLSWAWPARGKHLGFFLLQTLGVVEVVDVLRYAHRLVLDLPAGSWAARLGQRSGFALHPQDR